MPHEPTEYILVLIVFEDEGGACIVDNKFLFYNTLAGAHTQLDLHALSFEFGTHTVAPVA